MELSSEVKKNWRRRKYERLHDTGKDARMVRLGGKRKRSWRIRGMRKLKFKCSFVSPIKLLAKLRDAYVNMMLGLERRGGSTLHGENVFGAKNVAAPKNSKKSGSKKVSKEEQFEAKLIFEIYKSLKASRDRELAS